jgi:flavin reductase (DIM6/NTAB) family NADH-FMN oxidoreductase RutF
MTANGICSASLDPLLVLVLVCFDDTARTLPSVPGAGLFAVNMLRAGSEDVGRVFASNVPEGGEAWPVWHAVMHRMPGARGRTCVPAGDHRIAIGEVVAPSAG